MRFVKEMWRTRPVPVPVPRIVNATLRPWQQEEELLIDLLKTRSRTPTRSSGGPTHQKRMASTA